MPIVEVESRGDMLVWQKRIHVCALRADAEVQKVYMLIYVCRTLLWGIC